MEPEINNKPVSSASRLKVNSTLLSNIIFIFMLFESRFVTLYHLIFIDKIKL